MNREQVEQIRIYLDRCGTQRSDIIILTEPDSNNKLLFVIRRHGGMFLINNQLVRLIAEFGGNIRFVEQERTFSGSTFKNCLLIC